MAMACNFWRRGIYKDYETTVGTTILVEISRLSHLLNLNSIRKHSSLQSYFKIFNILRKANKIRRKELKIIEFSLTQPTIH